MLHIGKISVGGGLYNVTVNLTISMFYYYYYYHLLSNNTSGTTSYHQAVSKQIVKPHSLVFVTLHLFILGHGRYGLTKYDSIIDGNFKKSIRNQKGSFRPNVPLLSDDQRTSNTLMNYYLVSHKPSPHLSPEM